MNILLYFSYIRPEEIVDLICTLKFVGFTTFKEENMLVLALKENEKVLIGDNVHIMVVEIHGKQVHLGIEAPPEVLILREKLTKEKI
jgi:carbon storage regulator